MNQHGYCPYCNADLDGDLMYKTFMEKHGNTYEQALEAVSFHCCDDENLETARWDRKIGISDWDNITDWKCPDCGKTWRRR